MDAGICLDSLHEHGLHSLHVHGCALRVLAPWVCFVCACGLCVITPWVCFTCAKCVCTLLMCMATLTLTLTLTFTTDRSTFAVIHKIISKKSFRAR